VLGALQLIPKGVASGECALSQHFLESHNRLMPFGRTAETKLGLNGAALSFASIIGSIVLSCAMSSAVLTFTSCRPTSAPALSSAFNQVKLTNYKVFNIAKCKAEVKPGAALDACYGMFLPNPSFRTLQQYS